ncbi:recombinase family protein [Croceicoccus ponticola]|uniref:Recombinase family protein n=1 Tax=Croceicoccus ponticola TaxID=2217664 RepID=A0A437GW96_9SPHN|nr:recombinase family protein [Croceicoccus ponticola]RVQ66403.1 recombinase family protein [Croceicoccus ponticola]
MAKAPSPRLRCAIYTRKSTDEGLDKDFNSLDAQREACAAYVMSQRHEGWVLHPDPYDDGGCTGGNMERPGLQQLLDDVKAGLVDIVVVYKVDRLTRSLTDFARIVEVLDDAGASFVSVTQEFNTTNSMGRLTLNVLLSFAQFEREVISERIRDKVAASKAKGMWMGGPVPLGYRVEHRKLIVAPEEASVVSEIMQRYLACDTVTELLAEMEQDGIVTARRAQRDGSIRGGVPFRRDGLISLLSNRIYVGEIVHKGASYRGEHEGIIDRDLFDQVQAKLASQPKPRIQSTRHRIVSMLAGMLYDDTGKPMVPTHTRNHGRRYRYYVTRPSEVGSGVATSLPAPDLEAAVRTALAGYLSDSGMLRKLASDLPTHQLAALITHAGYLADGIVSASPSDLREALQSLGFTATINRDGVSASICQSALLQGASIDADDGHRIPIEIPYTFENHGHEQRLRLDPLRSEQARLDEQLLDLLARAFNARDQLLAMDEVHASSTSATEIRHLRRIARVSYLDPVIIKSFLDGTQPRDLTSRKLWRIGTLPIAWHEQKFALGFSTN